MTCLWNMYSFATIGMLQSDWTICHCQTECRQRCSCELVTQWSYTKRIVLIDVDIVSGKKKQIDSDLTWSVFISTIIFVITVVKICHRLTRNSDKLLLYCTVPHLTTVDLLIRSFTDHQTATLQNVLICLHYWYVFW